MSFPSLSADTLIWLSAFGPVLSVLGLGFLVDHVAAVRGGGTEA